MLSPKLTLVGRTLWFLQALDCAPVSFFPCFPAPAARPVCFWLQLPASCSSSSLVSGLVCFLELYGNWKFPLWGFKFDLVLCWDKCFLPPPPLTEFFRKRNVLHFLWGEKKKRLELLHGVSDRFQGHSRGSELPSWAWKSNIEAMRKVQWRRKAKTTKLGQYEAVGTWNEVKGWPEVNIIGFASLKRLKMLSSMFQSNHLFCWKDAEFLFFSLKFQISAALSSVSETYH